MHRTHTGGILAVALPGALAINAWLAVPILWGLGAARSLSAWIAAQVGIVVMMPEAAPFALVGIPVMILVRHKCTPGAIVDTARARLLSWLYLGRDWTWRGHGAGSGRLALEAAHVRSGGRALEGGPARNEWLELVYEYGLFAAVPMVALVAWGAASFQFRDAVSASAIAAAVVCCGTSPARAFYRWLRGDRESLFGPPLKASLTIHIDQDDNVHLYGSVVGTHDRDAAVAMARGLAKAADAVMHQHGISIEEIAE